MILYNDLSLPNHLFSTFSVGIKCKNMDLPASSPKVKQKTTIVCLWREVQGKCGICKKNVAFPQSKIIPIRIKYPFHNISSHFYDFFHSFSYFLLLALHFTPFNFQRLSPFCFKFDLRQQMGNVCPCPKRNKKKDFAYDVHEETFEMDENVQNIGEHSPKHEMHDPDNNILTEDLRGSEETTIQTSDSKEKEQEVKRADQFQPLSSNQISVEMKHQSEQQSLPLIEHKIQEPVVVVEQKPVVQSNILKPKTVKKKYNPDDYRFIKQTSSFKIKTIDSIKQQQYNIEDCKDCQFFIFDITANLYIDDCQNCTIFVAPCESTIFIRNCKRMVLIAATKQFRTYQCHDCVFSLYCKSQPVIESSSNLQFTSFQCPVYSELPKQFAKKRLEPWNNHWSEIHNFTKKQGEKHFSLHEKIQLEVDWERAFQLAELERTNLSNPIPFIVGDLHYEPKIEILILSNKATPDEKIIELLEGTTILKGFQGVIAGEGKEEKKAILIDALDSIPEKFQEIGKVFTNPNEIETNKGKWFVSFSDEREK